MSLIFGYVFEWDGFVADAKSSPNSSRFREAILELPAFKDVGKVGRARRWLIYKFRSPKPLNGEEMHSLPADFVYWYDIYVRVNEKTGSVIIAAVRYTIAEEAVRTFNTYVSPSLQRKVLNINDLSEHLLEKGARKEFAVTYLLADVPGYGSALTSLSLFGDDIGATDFLDEQNDEDTPRQILTTRQIGVRPMGSRTECCRLGSVGSLQFRNDHLADLEAFLSYAYQSGFYLE